MLQLLATALIGFTALQAQAHEPEASCSDLAFEQAVDYCYSLYRRSRKSYAHCKLGAAHTYEAILMAEATTNREICKPYFMRPCDSGRKLMLAKNNELCLP